MSILGGFIENKNWFIDSEIIAPEIAEQALEGRHLIYASAQRSVCSNCSNKSRITLKKHPSFK